MKYDITHTAGCVLSIGLLLTAGCQVEPPAEKAAPEPEPLSYAEALQVYNQELIALDRLVAEREKLQVSLDPGAMELVEGLLGQAGDVKAELQKTFDEIGDPSGLLDAPEGEQTDPLGELGQQMQQAKERHAGERADIEAQIAKLDEQIAEQKKRVARAEADKDAAEAARQ